MKLKYILYALIFTIVLYYTVHFFLKRNTHPIIGKTFVIARDPQWHPLDLMGKELDIQIFCDHLMTKIAEDQGFKVDIISVQNERLTPGLLKGEFNAIAYPVVEKWTNLGQYYFSQPIFALGPVLVIRSDQSNDTFANLQNKTIGVIRNSNLMSRLDSIPNINVAPFDNLASGFDNLVNNRIDGFILDAIQAYLYTEGYYKGILKIKQPALTKSGIKLITAHNSLSILFLEAFNQGLVNLFENHTYEALLNEWGFFNYPLPPIQKETKLSIDDGSNAP